jgi:hypothetical protein
MQIYKHLTTYTDDKDNYFDIVAMMPMSIHQFKLVQAQLLADGFVVNRSHSFSATELVHCPCCNHNVVTNMTYQNPQCKRDTDRYYLICTRCWLVSEEIVIKHNLI